MTDCEPVGTALCGNRTADMLWGFAVYIKFPIVRIGVDILYISDHGATETLSRKFANRTDDDATYWPI